MILGTLAQRAIASGPPAWLPEGAVAHLDFVNGQYYAGGAERQVGALLGGGFDSGEISASGMLVRLENTNRPNAIGALFTDLENALFSGGTVVVEFETISTAFGGLMTFLDGADHDDSVEEVQVLFDGAAAGDGLSMEDFWDLSYSGGGGDVVDTGVNRIAFTLAEDVGSGNREFAHSINGGTVASDTVTYLISDHMPAVETIALFHRAQEFGEMQAYIKTLTLYAAADSAQLPTLSA